MTQPPPINLPPLSGPSREECDYILGVYMRAWGYIETAMAELIGKLLDTDMTTSQIVVRALANMGTQREVASELGKHRLGKQDSDALDGFLEQVKKSATRRNRIVHGMWMENLEMAPPPNPKPLTAKSRKLQRIYFPAQRDELDELMRGKSQKLNAAYIFWPEQIAKDAKAVDVLAKDLNEFTKRIVLLAPRIPLPVEW